MRVVESREGSLDLHQPHADLAGRRLNPDFESRSHQIEYSSRRQLQNRQTLATLINRCVILVSHGAEFVYVYPSCTDHVS